eukprot:4038-Hanusia_phi.AAC.1
MIFFVTGKKMDIMMTRGELMLEQADEDNPNAERLAKKIRRALARIAESEKKGSDSPPRADPKSKV